MEKSLSVMSARGAVLSDKGCVQVELSVQMESSGVEISATVEGRHRLVRSGREPLMLFSDAPDPDVAVTFCNLDNFPSSWMFSSISGTLFLEQADIIWAEVGSPLLVILTLVWRAESERVLLRVITGC